MGVQNHSPDIWHFWKWLQWKFTLHLISSNILSNSSLQKWNFSSYNLRTKYASNFCWIFQRLGKFGEFANVGLRTGAHSSSYSRAGNSFFGFCPWKSMMFLPETLCKSWPQNMSFGFWVRTGWRSEAPAKWVSFRVARLLGNKQLWLKKSCLLVEKVPPEI